MFFLLYSPKFWAKCLKFKEGLLGFQIAITDLIFVIAIWEFLVAACCFAAAKNSKNKVAKAIYAAIALAAFVLDGVGTRRVITFIINQP